MKHEILDKLLNRYKKHKAVQHLNNLLDNINPTDDKKLTELYSNAIPLLEDCIWNNHITDATLTDYQKLFQEYETHVQSREDTGSRYKFIIAIPVADRPQHLNTCLQSILTLCKLYQYGGVSNGVYRKISILVADDSQHQKNIHKNRQIVKTFINQGLDVIYFGEQQQKEILSSIDTEKSQNITGTANPDKFYHKGASITRNITYLKLQQMQRNNEPCLFYFIDSDQEFRVNIQTENGSKEFYAINYFYHLNKIFSQGNTSVLTGKVVGDPPVSPAVMAGTFVDDIIYFIQKIAELNPEHSCQFHGSFENNTGDAAYHDMADLFGFKTPSESYTYHCTLEKPHNNNDCLKHFLTKLNQFFDGGHPTRKSYYQYENLSDSIKPARTIYTGNYIFKADNLKYFIPFANLKLRMAGPVLGRIIKAELGDQFISANLPMLHKRTIDETGQSEFRPGVNHVNDSVDLSDEFIRQFFGDVMLFSIIELTEMGYPKKELSLNVISEIINKNFLSMKSKYLIKQHELSDKINTLKSIANNTDHWWNLKTELPQGINNLKIFILNIENNFAKDAPVYQAINTHKTVNAYTNKIADAIASYRNDLSYWKTVLSTRKPFV